MTIPNTITIDGPAASGKSTLGLRLAKELGYLFFDTGVMYRAVTWTAIDRGVDINDEEAIVSLSKVINIDVRPPTIMDGRTSDILVDGIDITWEIRRSEVDSNVSKVSAYPGVRQSLSTLQRRIGLRGNIVMVGRDIGTVVLPEAEIKLFLDASVEERARRRYTESISRGDHVVYQDILKAMKMRDQIDSTREIAPLIPADDAIVLISDNMDADQVLQQVKDILDQKTDQ